MGLPGKKNWPIDSTLLSPTPANLVLGVDLLRSWCYTGFHTGAISESVPLVSDAIGGRGQLHLRPLPPLLEECSLGWMGVQMLSLLPEALPCQRNSWL